MAQIKNNIVTIGSGQISQASISSRIIASNYKCDIYNSGITYGQYNVVEYGSNLYRSIAGGNLGNQPDISPTLWAPELLAVHDGDIHIVNNGTISDIQQRIGGAWASIVGQPIKVTLTDNTSGVAFTYSAGNLPYAEINYTIIRGTSNSNKRQGKIIILNDGGTLQYSHEFNEIGIDVDVALSLAVGGGSVSISHVTGLYGLNAELSYTVEGWV
jgi:hypothetical protein